MKNPQFSSNHYETWSKLQSHGREILPKSELDWPKIVDFSLIPYFRASPIFYFSLFSLFHRKRYRRVGGAIAITYVSRLHFLMSLL